MSAIFWGEVGLPNKLTPRTPLTLVFGPSILALFSARQDANTISENREAGKEGEDDRSSLAHDSAQEAALQNRCEALLGERKAMQASFGTNGTKW